MQQETFKEIVMNINDFEDSISFKERVKWIARYPHLEISIKELQGCSREELARTAQELELKGQV